MSRSYAIISRKDNWRTQLKINYDIIDLKITGKPVKPVKLARYLIREWFEPRNHFILSVDGV